MSKPDPLTMLAAGLSEAKAARATIDRAITALEQALQQGIQDGLDTIPSVTIAASEHRRLHRPSNPPKIDSDPDLQAFILARIDCMTFHQIADDIAQNFPEPLRVHAATVHRWWQRQRKAKSRS